MSGPASGPWAQYATYNRLANETLYAACAGLSGAEYRRDLGAFFGSVHGTLNHLLLGDTIWMTRFEGSAHPSTNLDAILFEKFDALRLAREQMDRRIVHFFSKPSGRFKRSADGEPAAFLQSPDPSPCAGPHAAVATGLSAASTRPAPRAAAQSDLSRQPHPEEPREARRLEGWATGKVLVPTLRDAPCGRSSG